MRTRWMLFSMFAVIAGLYGLVVVLTESSLADGLNAPAAVLATPVLFVWSLLPFSPSSAFFLTAITVIAADMLLGGLAGYALGWAFERRGR